MIEIMLIWARKRESQYSNDIHIWVEDAWDEASIENNRDAWDKRLDDAREQFGAENIRLQKIGLPDNAAEELFAKSVTEAMVSKLDTPDFVFKAHNPHHTPKPREEQEYRPTVVKCGKKDPSDIFPVLRPGMD